MSCLVTFDYDSSRFESFITSRDACDISSSFIVEYLTKTYPEKGEFTVDQFSEVYEKRDGKIICFSVLEYTTFD